MGQVIPAAKLIPLSDPKTCIVAAVSGHNFQRGVDDNRECPYQREDNEEVIPSWGAHDAESRVEPKAHGSPSQNLKGRHRQCQLINGMSRSRSVTYHEGDQDADEVRLAVRPRQPIVGVGAMAISGSWHRHGALIAC